MGGEPPERQKGGILSVIIYHEPPPALLCNNPVTISKLCPHCPASWFLPTFRAHFLVFNSVNFWYCSNTFHFSLELISSCLLLESRNLTVTMCKVHSTTRAHSKMLIEALNTWCMLLALVFRNSHLMPHTQFICSWCVIFCWNTNLNCFWNNTHHIISCLIFYQERVLFVIIKIINIFPLKKKHGFDLNFTY